MENQNVESRIAKVIGRGRSRQLTTRQVMIVGDGRRYKILDYCVVTLLGLRIVTEPMWPFMENLQGGKHGRSLYFNICPPIGKVVPRWQLTFFMIIFKNDEKTRLIDFSFFMSLWMSNNRWPYRSCYRNYYETSKWYYWKN